MQIADAADGSGATAALTGTGGLPVTVQARGWEDVFTTSRWQPAAGRTGDGGLAVPLPPGWWHVYAETSAERGAVLSLRTTDGLAPLPERCRDAVQAALRLAVGEDFPGGVEVLLRFRADLLSRPGVAITADGLELVLAADLAGTDLVQVPVLAFCVQDESDPAPALRALDRFRMAVVDAFHRRRVPGVAECRDCEVESVGLDPDDARTKTATTGQLIRVNCRKPRPGGMA